MEQLTIRLPGLTAEQIAQVQAIIADAVKDGILTNVTYKIEEEPPPTD